MTVQLYAEPTDSLCSLALPTLSTLDLTVFSGFTTVQGVHCVGKDVISQMGGDGAIERVSGRGDVYSSSCADVS